MRIQLDRPAPRTALLLGAIAACAVWFTACKDEIADPIFGRLDVALTSPTAGGFEGGKIWMGDSLLVADVDRNAYSFVLPVGSARIRFEKDCSEISPSSELEVEIDPGTTRDVRWDVAIADGGVEVTSSMRGAAIALDGEPTGEVTPATLTCLEPGPHTVSVELFGADAVAPKDIDVSSGVQQVSFQLEPLSQSRGAVMEVITATNCPNCGPVDAAAESLWTQTDLFSRGAFSIQIHTRWSIVDVFHTQSTLDRNLYYGDQERQGLPWRITNGMTAARGAGSGNIPNLIQAMRGEVEPFLDGDHGAPIAALYWTNTYRNAGQNVGGTLRVVMLADADAPEDTEVLGLDYKDRLVTFVAIHGRDETFYRVVRNIDSAGTLADLGLLHRGDWVDLDFQFDVSWDTDWTEEGMGLVALVQNLATDEIYQAVHVYLP
ncbi:MAG: PEGA domain-containing protein [Candidatus Eisenbacteria bacterium]|uniref:PEGA domain-containing protein n=1 Tax=Eiseniibacteriota bacterium TaxID=2212470 RepID=A0A956M1Z9_UNCEI|nr:PEGA domain-containing protein [Candidatus Eisenbacteria bacterium]